MLPSNYKLAERNSALSLADQLLVNRGVQIKDKGEFLNIAYEKLHNPNLLPNVEKAIDRVFEAIKNDEKIIIYADYDADGIPSAVILQTLFERLGHKNFEVYIPHRHDEGYGIHMEAMDGLITNGAKLIVAVDVGTTDFETASFAKEKGKDLIIIDHHTPIIDESGKQKLPDAYALVNPKLADSMYPEKMLCAGGVTFKFAQAFLGKYGEEFGIKPGWDKWLLDMAGIATISDMVPLLGENRILAHYGLIVARKGKRLGLRKLLEYSGVTPANITEDDIAFSVSPKINAASRMSHPLEAFRMLVASTTDEAEKAVEHLISLNTERKLRVAQMMKEAKSKLKQRELGNCLVIGDPEWSAGVLGLVANKLVEELQIPVFVWSEENGEIKGSCRGLPGSNLVGLMSALPSGTLIQFGGHSEAGGFTCEKNEIHFLEEKLSHVINDIGDEIRGEPILVDMELPLEKVNPDTYNEMKRLAPFGMNNPKPLFLFKELSVEGIKNFGSGKEHLEIEFRDKNKRKVKAIAFFKSEKDYAVPIELQSRINLLGNIEKNVFRHTEEYRLRIVDIF